MSSRILLVLIGSTVTFLTPGSGEAGVGDWLKRSDQTKEQVEKVEVALRISQERKAADSFCVQLRPQTM